MGPGATGFAVIGDPDSPSAVHRAAAAHDAGRSCPYCRFPIKGGGLAAVCTGCSAIHHAECWTDNQGCAVVGCAQAPVARRLPPRTSPRPPTTLPQATRQPPSVALASPAAAALDQPAAPRPRAQTRGLTLAVGGLALAVVGVAVVLLVTRSDAGTRKVVPPASISHAPATTSGPTAGAAPPAAASPGQTTTRPTDQTRYTGQGFAIGYPSGWSLDRREIDEGGYVESRWHLPGEPAVVLLIDHTVGTHGTAAQAGQGVRSGVSHENGYRELAWGSQALPAGPAQIWQFVVGGQEEIDTFLVVCGTGYGVLGKAPAAEFSQYQTLFAEATRSLTPDSCATG